MNARMTPEPNVTPMIDVLLVLLIIFMAAIPEQRKGLTGQLPDERSVGGTQAQIVLEVGRGGRYTINRQPVRSGQLEHELRAIYHGRPDKTLVVRGDRTARYQEVVTAIDLARGAGVTVVGIDPR